MTLTEFLTARLDEDEAAVNPDAGLFMLRCVSQPGVHHAPCRSRLWSRASARVLREVEAKRKILAMHEPVEFHGNNPRTRPEPVRYHCECQAPDGVIEGFWPCDTVRALLDVYSDHPDYQQEWA